MVVILALLVTLVASAQKDKEGFEPVDGNMMAQGESIPASRLVSAAYGFICAAMVVYAVSVASRTRKLEEEVETLKKKLEIKA
jgi:hypothetical protein